MTMNLTRYNFGLPSLRDEFKQAFEMLNRMARLDEGDQSNIVTSEWMPRVDIKEEDDRFVILADIPGVDPKDIEVSMDKGVLSIRGERRTESREETERYTRLERSRGVFYRRFALPDSADPDGIRATGRNGELEITIPKRPESTPRRITVE
jgi:HSP20 family protein